LKAADALKAFFGTPDKPVSNRELLAFAKADKDGYNELVALAKADLEASDVGAVEVAV
jgi:hypothetical protein